MNYQYLNSPCAQQATKGGVADLKLQARLEHLLDIIGPDLRLLLRALVYQTDPADVLQDTLTRIRVAADKLDTNVVRSLIRHSSLPAGLPAHSHSLIITRPQTNAPDVPDTTMISTGLLPVAQLLRLAIYHGPHMLHSIRSPLVLRVLCHQWKTSMLEEMQDLAMHLQAHPQFGAPLGWIFESFTHDYICGTRSLTVHPMVLEGDRLTYSPDHQSEDLPIGNRKISIFTRNSRPSTTTSYTDYYVPAEANNPTFDAFLMGKDFGIGLQMTVGKTHSMKAVGMNILARRLASLPKAATRHFVFVIPKGAAFTIKQPPPSISNKFTFSVMDVEFGHGDRV